MSVDNKVAMGARFAWDTLQAHAVMEQYLKDRFRQHQAINSTYIRFIMTNEEHG